METLILLVAFGITIIAVYMIVQKSSFNANRKNPDKGGSIDNADDGSGDGGGGEG